ncbi:MAG: carbohydrate kinase family protein [Vulcanimicrobiota bacterium]
MKRPVVVGGASVDLKARPLGNLLHGTSNIGVVERTTGGVALNISLNLARLKLSHILVTLTGDDADGAYIREVCKASRVDTSLVRMEQGERTAIYQAVMDNSGELYVGISAMSIFDRLTPAFLSDFEPVLSDASFIVADTNIPSETLVFLSTICSRDMIPLWVEPTAIDKCGKLLPALSGITYLSPNIEELQELAGTPLGTIQDLYEAARDLVEEGVEHVFVTMGAEGVVWVTRDGYQHLPSRSVSVRDVNGAGDAFVSAVIWAILKGLPMEKALTYGNAAALLTIGVHESVYSALTPELLEYKQKEYYG